MVVGDSEVVEGSEVDQEEDSGVILVGATFRPLFRNTVRAQEYES